MRSKDLSSTFVLGAAGFSAAVVVWALAWGAPVSTVSPQARVEAAYAAMGGNRIAALKTISLKAHLAQHATDKSGFNSSELIQYRDIARGLTRNWWSDPLQNDDTRRNYSEVITATADWNTGNESSNGRTPSQTIQDNGAAYTLSGERLTMTLRELEWLSIVSEMKAHLDRVFVAPDQMIDGKIYPAVQYKGDYGTFTVTFDPVTNLPARVRTLDPNALGRSDAEFSDWRDVAGTKMPFHVFYTRKGATICDMTIRDVVANPELPEDTFLIPSEQLAKAVNPSNPRITPPATCANS
jgi:hypothetical protein